MQIEIEQKEAVFLIELLRFADPTGFYTKIIQEKIVRKIKEAEGNQVQIKEVK